MKISVVIPAFNEEKLLPATLAAVRNAASAFISRGWEWEICVCDNNSTDGTRAVAETVGARVAFEAVNQISRSRNTGASIAQGDWLIFVDADSQPSEGLFDDVSRQIEAGDVLGGGATVRMDTGDFVGAMLIRVWNGLSQLQRWAAGSFVYCSAAAFRELEGFSTHLYASEEVDFSQRLKKLAKRQKKRVVILHRHPLETSARKLHLYTKWEYARFFLRLLRRPFKTLQTRDECHVWYDGRR